MPSDELESDLLLLSSLCRQQLRQEQTHVSRRWPSSVSPGTGRGPGWGRGQSGWSLTASSLSTPSRAPEVLSSEAGLFAWPACPAPGALPSGLLVGGPAPLRAANPWAGEVTPGAHLQGHPDQENWQVRLWGWMVSLAFNNVYWTEEKGKWDEGVRSVWNLHDVPRAAVLWQAGRDVRPPVRSSQFLGLSTRDYASWVLSYNLPLL